MGAFNGWARGDEDDEARQRGDKEGSTWDDLCVECPYGMQMLFLNLFLT